MHFIQAKNILTSSGGKGTNVYRGCLHGCIYCDARSKCYQINHAFEDIAVKENAVILLEDALRRKRKPCMIGSGSMCDPYMPIEKDLLITRKCLEVIDKYGFGATTLTKSNLVLRDLDILQRINDKSKAVLQMTMTTFDEKLCQVIEPNVCSTFERFKVLCKFRDAGIPTVVWLTPILPFLNDTIENLEGLMSYCVEAGVKGIILWNFGVTLREGDREYFYEKLDLFFPELRHRYEQTYGNSYEVVSPNNPKLMRRFIELCEKNNIMWRTDQVFGYLNEYPFDKAGSFSPKFPIDKTNKQLEFDF